MRPSTLRLLAAAAALSLAAPAARAQQFTIDTDDVECSDNGAYFGAFLVGGDQCGVVGDGGSDAFDGYGQPVGYRRAGVTVTRRTETFADRNFYRFYDTYTNTTDRAITGLFGLSGELGSDSDSRTRAYGDGYVVTADGDPDDPNEFAQEGSDPVVAHVFGANAFARATFAGDLTGEDDNFFMGGRVTLAPGETRSFLFFAFLAYDEDRDGAAGQRADEALAIRRAEALVANPYVAGLSNAERARIANFDVGPPAVVPEPGTWALVGAGLAGLAGAARRRRRAE